MKVVIVLGTIAAIVFSLGLLALIASKLDLPSFSTFFTVLLVLVVAVAVVIAVLKAQSSSGGRW